MLRTLFAATAAAACLTAAGAAAASADERISLADLDLSRPSHAAIFDARIDRAADALCRDARRPGSRLSDRAFCEVRVRAEVMRQLPGAAREDYAEARRTRLDV